MTERSRSYFSIGDLSKKTSVKVETIRYYEKVGIVAAPRRTAGGNRLYGESDVRCLRFIRRARELGFPLNDVRALLALSKRDNPDCARTKEISEQHLRKVRARIASLRKLERSLSAVTRTCSPGKQASCPILAALDT